MLRGAAVGFAIIVLAGLASFVAVDVYPAHTWARPVYQQNECLAAAQIASEITRSHEPGEHGFHASVFSFSPKLLSPRDSFTFGYRVSRAEDMLGQSPALTFAALRFKYAAPFSLDCKLQFRKAAIPIKRLDLSVGPGPNGQMPENYSFMRIWLSGDGSKADLFIEMACGNLCGYGWHTLWRKTDGRWQLISKDQLWVS
jgi:hypothetical protein